MPGFTSLILQMFIVSVLFNDFNISVNMEKSFSDQYIELGYSSVQDSGVMHIPENDSTGFQWFWTLDGPHYGDSGSDLAVDDAGNVFLTGHHGGLDIDRDGELDLEADETDPFVMKLSWKENEQRVRMQWIKTALSPGFNMSHLIAADYDGGAYLMGRFREKITFDNGLILEGSGGNDAYIARYNHQGQVVWAIPFGGAANDVLWDITSDKDGNLYVLGWGKGSFPLDKRGTMFPELDAPVSIIISYDSDGAVRWSQIFEDPLSLRFINISPDGNLVVSGEFEGDVDFNNDGIIDLLAPENIDGFILQYGTDGNYQSSWSIGAGPGKVAFLQDGDIVQLGVVGGPVRERYGNADFDGDGEADAEMKWEGATNAYVARYTKDGLLRWVRSYNLDGPADITSDGKRIVICGSYLGVRDLDEDGIVEPSDRTVDASMESEIAILVINSEDGHPEEAWVAPGPGRDHAASVIFLPDKPIINVTGYIQLTADFSGDGTWDEGLASCEALGDIFYAEYRLEGIKK